MKRSSILGLLGIGVAVGALIPFAAHQRSSAAVLKPTPTAKKTPLFPTHELEELNRVVQARFATIPVDGYFGFDRAVHPGGNHGTFYPNSKSEIAAVSKLHNSKQQVVFYLVGRPRFVRSPMIASRFKGPLVMTAPYYGLKTHSAKQAQEMEDMKNAVSGSAPEGLSLVPLADKVLAQPSPDEGAQKQIGEWKVVACPVTASSPACVTCHNNMAQAAAKQPSANGEKPDLVSLHDPLGVALYCVRTAPQKQRRTAQQTVAAASAPH